jgi:mono/diheme cytochrome c family protein
MRAAGLTASIVLLCAGAAIAAVQAKPEPPAARQALALLGASCLACHGADAKGGLDLRTRASALKGGTRGPAVVPGRAAESLLYKVVAGHAQPAMPQGGSLKPAQVALLKKWIDAGAQWPVVSRQKAEGRRQKAEGSRQKAAEGSSPNVPHWAFRAPVRPAVPKIRDRRWASWVRNPVDAFILDALLKKGLPPSPPADRLTLLRRVTFDLTGLPPTPDEVEAFLRDCEIEDQQRRRPNAQRSTPKAQPLTHNAQRSTLTAYEKVVRRLLASPRYGERWAQHWLDVVRFGETNGFELDADRPQAWRYRDWVVRALNEDMPYDRFITEQIAGDEIDPNDFDLRVATGFLRGGPIEVVSGNVDPAVKRQDWLTEAVAGVGNAMMGLTIGCAKCHDHKYDPNRRLLPAPGLLRGDGERRLQAQRSGKGAGARGCRQGAPGAPEADQGRDRGHRAAVPHPAVRREKGGPRAAIRRGAGRGAREAHAGAAAPGPGSAKYAEPLLG